MLFHRRRTCYPKTPPRKPTVTWNYGSSGKQVTEAVGTACQCWDVLQELRQLEALLPTASWTNCLPTASWQHLVCVLRGVLGAGKQCESFPLNPESASLRLFFFPSMNRKKLSIRGYLSCPCTIYQPNSCIVHLEISLAFLGFFSYFLFISHSLFRKFPQTFLCCDTPHFKTLSNSRMKDVKSRERLRDGQVFATTWMYRILKYFNPLVSVGLKKKKKVGNISLL